MSTYYEYQDVKVKIAHRLMKMDGWTVYGYSAGESDPYTDYYDPAYWSGIATKNGYALVIDRSDKQEEKTETRTRETSEIPAEIRAKIAKLERMTTANGASVQEEETAKKAIEALKEKETAGQETYTIYTPGHLPNPPRCNWHIEKDGIIIEKGAGLLKFADVADVSGLGYAWEIEEWQRFNNLDRAAWVADYMTRDHWGQYPTEEEAQRAYDRAVEKYALLDEFNRLIAKFNNTAGGMVGNAGENGYIYEEVVKTKYKEELKPVKDPTGEIKEGQCFILRANFNYSRFRGFVYRIHETESTDKDGNPVKRYHAYKLGKGYKKECTGTANNANYWSIWDVERFLKFVKDGSIEFVTLETVKTPYEVKKVVKKRIENETNEEPATATDAKEATKTTTTATGYTITPDTDTRDGSPLWVVTLPDRVSREQFDQIREQMKTAGGYYSRFKKGFIFREDPTEKLNGTSTETAEKQEEQTPAPDPVEEPAEEIREFTENGKTGVLHAEIEIKGNKYIVDAAKIGESYEVVIMDDTGETLQEVKTETAAEARRAFWMFSEMTPDPEKKKTVQGYTGTGSDLFTPEEVEQLQNGAQVTKGAGYQKKIYIATATRPDVFSVFNIHVGDCGDIRPGYDAKYSGSIVKNVFYSSFENVKEALTAEINAEIMRNIPDEETAEKRAGSLEDYQKSTIETLKNGDYTREARNHFTEDTRPELTLYKHYESLKDYTAIDFLLDPAGTVEEIARDYEKQRGYDILYSYITYNRTMDAYRAILGDHKNPAHMLKRIYKAIPEDVKTVKLLFYNGDAVRVEANAARRLPYCGTISSYHVLSSDRQYLKLDERGRLEDIKPEEIKQIQHGAKILYIA